MADEGGRHTTTRVRVQIHGREYPLRGDLTEEELRQLARVVDQVMHRISTSNPRLDSERVAVLAALNLAEELHRLRREYEDLLTLLDERTQTPLRFRA
ncbi:MAG: cell division protein ZapA [Thermoflavifilum sp.]|nr:cell division protein ZapA [Thermoflavifilum sp.]MCL6512815.1 cell division protein ZapA [Alicyclobacillus sp.]